MPRLAKLLSVAELGLELLEGDADVEYHAVRDADSAADRPWLASGDLRLSEGPWPPPAGRPDPLFVESPVAIAYALSPRLPELPRGLREKAASSGVALIRAPATVSLRRLANAALRLELEETLPVLSAVGGVHRHLLGALTAPKPERELLERASLLSGASLLLLAPWGEIVARAGAAAWTGPGTSLRDLSAGRYRVDGREAVVMRVERGGRLLGVLVALETDLRWLPLLEACTAILRLVLLERSAEAREDQVDRAKLLGSWLAGEEFELLAPRLARVGFDRKGSLMALVAEAGKSPDRANRSGPVRKNVVEQLRQAGEEYLLAKGVGVLSERRDQSCLWLVAAGSLHATPLLRALEVAVSGPIRLGISRPHPVVTGPSGAYFQAVLAMQSVSTNGGSAEFSELDPIYWVLQQQSPAHLRALRDGMVGAIKEADDGKLWHTLERYLAMPGNLADLAQELGIHANTLRYRLRRIEELLGRPLSQPETLAQLHLAERIDRLLAEK